MRLSEQEQEQLHLLIVAFIGEDAAISQARPRFTEQTVAVVEDMIASNLTCNEAMESLGADLVSGGRVLATGWLRRSLGQAARAIKKSTLKGYGCLVTTKARWKTDILVSAM